MNYTVIFEQGDDGSWGGYVPDLPGIAVGSATREDTEVLLKEAIAVHIAGLKRHGYPVPAPVTVAATVTVAA